MNLFVLGWSPSGGVNVRVAEAALRGLIIRLPFFEAADLETWSAPSTAAALAFVTHRSEQVGDVRYVHREADRMACFSGRPFRWVSDTETDGRIPLDPHFYLAPVEDWMSTLDGRAVVARYDDTTRTLDLWTDPLGSYPVFSTELNGVRWISNNAEVLHALHGSDAQDPAALAGLLGGGWPLDGHPRWANVKRLPARVVHHYRPEAPNAYTELLPLERIATLFGAGWDPEDAAAVLVAAFQGLADWPGRPNVVGVTGGRDSRLVLAAALRAGVDFTAATEGADDDPEVRVARLLCQTVGVQHDSFVRTAESPMTTPTDSERAARVLDTDPERAVRILDTDPERAARVLDLVCSGTASLGDARSLPIGPPSREGSLALWHSGHGGEPGRAYWGLGEGQDRDGLVRLLSQRYLNPRPWRPDLLSPEGRDLVQYRLRSWVDELLAAGVSTIDVVDAFYLLVRMGVWAGPTHGWHEWVSDTTAPLWSLRLLPHLFGAPADARTQEVFHRRVLETLAPRFLNLPFSHPASASPGSSWRRDHIEYARKRARQVIAELRRRGPRRFRPTSPPELPASLIALVRERSLSQREHPAWAVLDAVRVKHLLGRDPRSLDPTSQALIWRLATVFLV